MEKFHAIHAHAKIASELMRAELFHLNIVAKSLRLGYVSVLTIFVRSNIEIRANFFFSSFFFLTFYHLTEALVKS